MYMYFYLHDFVVKNDNFSSQGEMDVGKYSYMPWILLGNGSEVEKTFPSR